MKEKKKNRSTIENSKYNLHSNDVQIKPKEIKFQKIIKQNN